MEQETNSSNRLSSHSYGNRAIPYSNQLQFGSWNVEGLTETKLYQLCDIMRSRALTFVCLQETRVPYSGSRILDNGYLLITSGTDNDKKTFLGVGFLVAPWARRAIFSFKTISERLCYLKLRVHGGKALFFNTYAPHGGYEYNVRQTYFTELRQILADTSTYGPKFLVGDLNARIHNSIGGEGQVFGPHCFGNPNYNPEMQPYANRELLLEMCVATGFCVANTFLETAAENQITYHELWAQPMAPPSFKDFAQLDHILASYEELWQVRAVRSDRRQALASHHFLVEIVLDIRVDRNRVENGAGKSQEYIRYDLSALRRLHVQEHFGATFRDLAH